MRTLLYIPELFGFSIEVYFIVIILGIPVFFFWRWLFSKRQMTKVGRRVATWVATLLFTPVLYVALIILCIFIADYYPNRDFDKDGWIKNKDSRYEYSEDIIKSKMLIGKSKKEVRKVLGDEGNLESSNSWGYNLGNEPDSIDEDYLDIEFRNGRVVSVSHNRE